jgi:hypothetical protein
VNISFDYILVIYINSKNNTIKTNIPTIKQNTPGSRSAKALTTTPVFSP